MRIIQAVSQDGFIANGPNDDMRWTGPTDKNLFRILTLASSTDPIGVSRRTADTFGGKLKGRKIIQLTRDSKLTLQKNEKFMTLEDFCIRYPNGWIGGGAEIWDKAMRLDQAGLIMVSHIIRCRSWHLLAGYKDAIPDPVQHHLASRFDMMDPMQEMTFGDIRVAIWRHQQAWAAA